VYDRMKAYHALIQQQNVLRAHCWGRDRHRPKRSDTMNRLPTSIYLSILPTSLSLYLALTRSHSLIVFLVRTFSVDLLFYFYISTYLSIYLSISYILYPISYPILSYPIISYPILGCYYTIRINPLVTVIIRLYAILD
jgi:hypothetical protein